MKLLAVVLAGLVALIQYPLWIGQGSWLRVWDLDRQLGLQQEVNAGKRMRNEGLEAEVSDLNHGTLAIEERARYELGMVKNDEIFVQFNPAGTPGGAGSAPGVSPGIPRPPGSVGAGPVPETRSAGEAGAAPAAREEVRTVRR